MKRSIKAFRKRFFCLLFAMVLLLAYVPDLTPKAQATAGVIPAPPNMLPYVTTGSGSVPMVDGYSTEDITALFETMGALQRAIGVQYVGIENTQSGVYLPTDKSVGKMLEAATAIYNGLEAAEKTQVWQQAQELKGYWTSGTKSVLQFGSGLLDKVTGKYKTLYPTQSTFYDGTKMVEYTGRINIVDMIALCGTAISQGSRGPGYADYMVGKILYLSDLPTVITIYNNTGIYRAFTEFQTWGGGFGVAFFKTNQQSADKYDMSIIKYGINGIGETVLEQGSGFVFNYNDALGLYLTPPANTTNDAPEEYAPTTTLTLPTYPWSDDAWQRLVNALTAINGATYPELTEVANPALPGTDEDEKDKDLYPGTELIQQAIDLIYNLIDKLRETDMPDAVINPVIDQLLGLIPIIPTLPKPEVEKIIKKVREWIDGIHPPYPIPDDIVKEITDFVDDIIPDPDPPNPDGGEGSTTKKLDFKPLMSITGVAEIFPFSIPFDIAKILTSFKATSKEPIFYVKLPLLPKQGMVDLTLDMTVIAPLMPLAKFFIWTMFVIGLAMATSKLIKW